MNKYSEALDRMYDNYVYGAKQKEDSYFTLQELVDKVPYYEELEAKATPKKPNKLDYKLLLDEGWKYECPTCKCAIGINDNASYYTQEEGFCPTCGQAIDWSKE